MINPWLVVRKNIIYYNLIRYEFNIGDEILVKKMKRRSQTVKVIKTSEMYLI